MIEYKSESVNEIVGRGKVFVVVNERERKIRDGDLHGQQVKIDGVVYLIKGVEAHVWHDDGTIQKGQRIGLLVKEI